MYIYFDSNGTIKEIVNDVAIRKGSADYNKLYVYIEGNPEIDDIWYFQKFPNGSTSNEVSFINNVVIKSIPYDAKRDMTYFKDFVQYKFYVFTLTSEYLNISGLAIGTIRIAVDNSIFALGELTFNVQANEVNADNGITQSQYNYLLLAYASRTLSEYTSRDLENYIDDIINAKVEELNPLQPSGTGTTAYITSQTSDIGILISTDNGHWYYWNGTQYADGGNYQAPFYNSSNKLNADYVDDTNSTHKFVTASEKAQIATNTTAIANRYTKAETNTLLGKKVNYIDFDNSADVTLSNYVYTITGETAEIIKSMNCIIKCTAETFSDMFYPNNFDMVLLPSCIENGLYIYKCVYNTTDYGNNVLYTPFYIEDDVLKAKLTLTAQPITEKSTKGMKLITNVYLSSYGNPIQKRMYFRYGTKNVVNESTYEDFFKIALINGDAVFGGNGTTLDFTATSGQLKNVKLNSNNYHVFNNQEDLVDNLTSNDDTKALTAKQGKVLKALIDAVGTGNDVYVVQSTDITNFTPAPDGSMQVTLSQDLEDVILGFKKLVYIDWENDFPALYSAPTKVTLFAPTKIMTISVGIDGYLFSCVDGAGDITIAFFKVDNDWHFIKSDNQLLTQEGFDVSLASKVIPNPTLDGTESNLTGLEVLGTKYKVGGGSEVHLYNHHCYFSGSSGQYSVDIILDNNTPLIFSTLISALSNIYGSGTNTYFDVTAKNETIYVSRAFVFGTVIRVRCSVLSNISSFYNYDCDTLVSDVVSQIF